MSLIQAANAANQGMLVKALPGVGKPFWRWPTIPFGTLVGADFTNAPIVSSDAQANNAAITTAPEDVLIYQE